MTEPGNTTRSIASFSVSQMPLAALIYATGKAKITEWNDLAARLLGYEPSETPLMPDIRPGWKPLTEADLPQQNLLLRHRTKKGEEKMLQVQRSFFNHESVQYCLETFTPEPDLPKSRFGTIFHEVITEASIVTRTDLKGTITFANRNFEKISGYSLHELIGQNHRIINSGYHPKSFWIDFWRTISKGLTWKGQVKNRRKDGTFYWVDTLVTPLRDSEGDIYEFVSIRNDITSQKEQESQIVTLNQSLCDFQNAIHRSSIVSKADHTGRINFVNENFIRISGYTEDELIGKNHRIINSGHHPRQFWIDMWKTISSGSIWRAEVKNRAKDGSFYWVDTFIMPFINPDGTVREYLSIRNDITERKQAEFALEHSLLSMGKSFDHRFKQFLEHLPGFLYQFRMRNNGTSHFPFATKAVIDLFGITPEQIAEDSTSVFNIIHPEELERIKSSIAASAATLTPWHQEFRIIHPSGATHWLEGNSSPQLMPDKSVLWSGYILDITPRKTYELALEESKDRYLSMLDNLPGYIFRINAETNELSFISREVASVTGYDSEEYLEKGSSLWRSEIRHEDLEKLRHAMEYAIARFQNYECEYRLTTRDGSEKWIWERGKGLYDRKGILQKIEGFATDVTPRKKAEDKLIATLSEKEALVKEIHHRIKNNLQVISSIIFIKMAGLEDSDLKFFLEDTRQKIRAIALIHERLLQSEAVSVLDIADYLSKLLKDITRTHSSSHSQIECECFIEPLDLGLDTAVYCGLIMNELVTNSIKHAFTGRDHNKIMISLKKEDDWLKFVIADNGTPIPEDIQPGKTKSFGMKLIDIFIKQLHGTFEIDRTEGTRFTIAFQNKALPLR